MSSRILLVVLLSSFALPGFSQSADSGAGANQAAPPAAVSERDPIPSPTSKDFWDGDDPNLVNLVSHPFANKKYVRRLTTPIKDRLNELDEITAANAKSIRDVDARSQQGIQLASEKVNLADTHAGEASTRAQSAQTAATDASKRVATAEQMVGNLDQFKGGAQTEIRFRSGQSVLSKQAKDALDAVASPLQGQHAYIVEVQGFSAGRGQAAIAASRKMADSVVRYLVLSCQIPVYRIHVVGLGDAAGSGDGTVAKRISGGRVEVTVLRNELITSTQH